MYSSIFLSASWEQSGEVEKEGNCEDGRYERRDGGRKERDLERKVVPKSSASRDDGPSERATEDGKAA